MRQSLNRYEYLYHSLVRQLKSGVFRHGQALPSQQEFCRQYSVGITTVRKVLKMLDENGFIHAAQGQPATVTYLASSEAYLAALASRRAEIADAYRSLELMMPPLYTEGAKLCGAKDLKRLDEIILGISELMEAPALYQQTNAFFQTLLRPLKNGLVMDLETDVEDYLHVPYISLPNVENPFALTPERLKNWLLHVVSLIKANQYDLFYESILSAYRDSRRRVDQYLHILEARAPVLPCEEEHIDWFHGKEHSELFSRLAMTILRRITAQEFDGRKYLPSIPKLMQEYQVTKDTASRAVALLNSLGITQTLDKKGTILSSDLNPVMNGPVNWNDPAIRRRLSYFLEALQIVILTIENCAAHFTPVSKDWVHTVENRLDTVFTERLSPFSVQFLMNYFIRSAPYHALQNIYRQLNELIIWGHYLQAADPSLYPDCGAITREMKRIVTVMQGNDYGELPAALKRFFSLIHRNISILISNIPELSSLVGP